jgi:hypothetical protein
MPPPAETASSKTTRSSAKRIVSAKAKGADNYNILGVVVILLAGLVIYGSNFAVNAATEIKDKLTNMEQRYEKAIRDESDYSKRVVRAEDEIRDIRIRAALWKTADEKIGQPWTINVADWLATTAREENPPIITEGTTSEAGTAKTNGTIEMKVSGNFQTILEWLTDAEHELDMIRVIKAVWSPRDSKNVELDLKIEVANE